jgi:ArpU family phage transcriptional regulator
MAVVELDFTNVNVTKREKKYAEKYMTCYFNLEGIIKAKQLNVETKMTTNYQASESQRTNGFSSEVERIAQIKIQIQEYTLLKGQLDELWNGLTEKYRFIWEQRFIKGKSDAEIWEDLGISRKTYYQEKPKLIAMVVDACDLRGI